MTIKKIKYNTKSYVFTIKNYEQRNYNMFQMRLVR